MKQTVIYRVCDKCPPNKDVPAEEAHQFSFNGHRWNIDLCEKHSAEFYGLMMSWGDLGTKTAEPKAFEGPRQVREIVNTVKKPKPAPAQPAQPAQPELPQVGAQVIDLTIPQLPKTASRWRLTDHAIDRMRERNFSDEQVRWACERPTMTRPSAKGPNIRVQEHDWCSVVVDTDTLEVLTVQYASAHPLYEPELARAKAAN